MSCPSGFGGGFVRPVNMEHTWNFRPVQGGLPRSPPFPPANFSMDFRHPPPLPGYENPQQPVFQRPFFDPLGHFRHDDRLLGQPGYHPGGPPAMPGFEHRPGHMGFVRPEFRVNPAHVAGHFPEQRRWDNPQVRGGISDPPSWNSFPGPNLDRRSLNDGHGNHPTFGGTSALSVDRWNEKTQTACEGFDNRVSNTVNWGSSGYAGTFGDDRVAPVVGRGFEEQRLVESGTVYKRPRLEDGSMVEYNEYGYPSSANAGKRSLEDERLSNLIRDHGGYSGPIGQTRFQEQPTSPYPLDGSFDAMSFQGRPHLPEGAPNRWSGVDQLRESSMNGARRGLDMEHQRPFRNEFPAILQPELGSSVQHGEGPSQPDLGSGNYGSHAAAGNPQSNDHPERGVTQSQDLYHGDQIFHDSDILASGYSNDRESHFLYQQMLPQTLTLQSQTRMRLDSSGHANQRMFDHTDQNQDRAVSHQEKGSSNRQGQFFLPPSKQGFSKISPQVSQFTSDHDCYGSRVDMASNNQQRPPPDNSFGIGHTSQQLRDGHINYHTVEIGKQQHPRHVVGTPNESHGQQDTTLPPENCGRNFGQSNENYFFPEMGPGSHGHLRNRQQMSQPLLGALPLAEEPPYPPSHENQVTPSPLTALKYPGISSTSSVLPSSVAIPGHALPEARPPAQGCHASLPTIAFPREGFLETQFLHPTEEVQPFSLKKSPGAKPKVVDATHLFMPPHRTTRPDHIVIILRGLPGSGKSYLAKTLRDLEVSNGGNAPRIHSMDDYFMTEVEKVEESESSKTSGVVKGKRIITKKVMEYCYEPEMEEVYRASMLKAFKKTLEDGIFKFVIVDDRNLRVADFAQFWATAKRSGYEVYILEATYRDIAGCAARNVHGFTSEDIQKMADNWEHTPPLYLQLNTQSLFHGDDLTDQGIAEVEMDMEEVDCSTEEPLEKNDEKLIKNPDSLSPDYEYERDHSGIGQRWQAEISDSLREVKEIEKSKWSNNMDEVADVVKPPKKVSQTALSGLIQAYGKGDKSLRWGDHDGRSGFAIGVGKKSKSLIIGPGAGYNLDSNPLPEEETASESDHSSSGESKRRIVFLEHLRAEQESFRAVFDRRRQRIGGLDLEDD